MRLDPREQLLAKLNRVREERMDCDPTDTVRYDELTQLIDDALDALAAMRGEATGRNA